MSIIQTITPLLESAVAQKKAELGTPNASARFITIDCYNTVRNHHLLANIVYDDMRIAICCVRTAYLSYGWKENYHVFSVVDYNNKIISGITATGWQMEIIGFNAVPEGNTPRPEMKFSLISDPAESFRFTTYSFDDFQIFWNLFLGIDQNCKTVSEGKLYSELFVERLNNSSTAADLIEYRNDLDRKTDIIKQYENLLMQIEGLVNR